MLLHRHEVGLLGEVLNLLFVNDGPSIDRQGLFVREAAVYKIDGERLPVLLTICVIFSRLPEVKAPMVRLLRAAKKRSDILHPEAQQGHFIVGFLRTAAVLFHLLFCEISEHNFVGTFLRVCEFCFSNEIQLLFTISIYELRPLHNKQH